MLAPPLMVYAKRHGDIAMYPVPKNAWYIPDQVILGCF